MPRKTNCTTESTFVNRKIRGAGTMPAPRIIFIALKAVRQEPYASRSLLVASCSASLAAIIFSNSSSDIFSMVKPVKP